MARTPFSLVDEINQVSRAASSMPLSLCTCSRLEGPYWEDAKLMPQGMDQRAERNVHDQLVKVTCGENAGQYFLITPKLLTGLTYHRKMKVLIVNNGNWRE